jgi:hypothetical protein
MREFSISITTIPNFTRKPRSPPRAWFETTYLRRIQAIPTESIANTVDRAEAVPSIFLTDVKARGDVTRERYCQLKSNIVGTNK